MFRLEGGATGFRSGHEPKRPEVTVRAFRGSCHGAARAAGGAVERVVERTYPGTFHSAVITAAPDRYAVLCHVIHPWIAFIEEGTGSSASPGFFVDPPMWATVFAETNFMVLSRRLLESPLSEVDTTALTKADWSHIRSWRPSGVGQTLFNSWD